MLSRYSRDVESVVGPISRSSYLDLVFVPRGPRYSAGTAKKETETEESESDEEESDDDEDPDTDASSRGEDKESSKASESGDDDDDEIRISRSELSKMFDDRIKRARRSWEREQDSEREKEESEAERKRREGLRTDQKYEELAEAQESAIERLEKKIEELQSKSKSAESSEAVLSALVEDRIVDYPAATKTLIERMVESEGAAAALEFIREHGEELAPKSTQKKRIPKTEEADKKAADDGLSDDEKERARKTETNRRAREW